MKPRKVIKKIHLWLTLIFFLPLVIQGLTGTVLVFEHEIEDLISGNHQEYKLPANQENQELQSANKIIDAAWDIVPENYSPMMVKFSKNEPTMVSFMAKQQPKISVAVDPFTLEILGQEESKPNAFLRTIHLLHTNLLIEGKTGRELIGYVGLVMLLMLISGIIIWFPKEMSRLKNGFFVRFSDIGYNFHKGLHKAVGIWTYVIFFIITFSGVYFAFPQYIEPMLIEGKMRERITLSKIDANVIDANEAIRIAREYFPLEKISSITISNTTDKPYRVSFEPEDYLTGGPMINVNIDPVTGDIIKIQNPTKYNAAETFLAWQTPLHYGQAYGMWYKILVFLTGFLPLLFTITGISMWWKKKKGKEKSKIA